MGQWIERRYARPEPDWAQAYERLDKGHGRSARQAPEVPGAASGPRPAGLARREGNGDVRGCFYSSMHILLALAIAEC